MKRLLPLLVLALAACATPSARPHTDRLGLDALTAAVETGAYQRIEAIIVERDGAILYERYFGEAGPDTRIDARSAGKSITALALGAAIDDGMIASVDAPALAYFDAEAPIAHDSPVKRAVTLRDLLTMSSALDCDDWREESPGNEERMYETRDWTRFALDIPATDGYVRDAQGYGRFSYCTAGAFLLGRIVERAAGEPFDAYVERRLFAPLGIVAPEWRRSPLGQVQSGGQLGLRARDFQALGRLVLDDGVAPDGRRLVSAQWLREMTTPVRQANSDDGYGYLWWTRSFSAAGARRYHSAYMSGNGGNKVVVVPELDAVVVVLSTVYNQPTMHRQSTDLIERHILPTLRL
ncbi:MAG: serine hydrolase [Hyphomonadaceae bacterium]|nr:serine hydrolase [Hyphomonadaceae bacterium]